MTLFSIAWRNIKRQLYDYFLYFGSMVFSIMIYFTFVSIKFNRQVLELGQSHQQVASTFTASSVVLAVFALIFIWYSNSFFTRKRKKEIGLYSLLGIKKRQIGLMLFYENIVIGIMALAVGIFLGGMLSRVFVMLLIRLMDFAVPVKFTIIPEAIFSTLKVFAVLFVLTSLHSYTIIYRFKLVELFKAGSSAEKEPGVSTATALLSFILIGGGYLFYTYVMIEFLTLIMITLILVVTGTYLLFSSLMVLVIKLARRNRRSYYRGINMVGTTNLLYRIKSHARTLATIAVLSATTITAISATASLYYDFKIKLDTAAPFSYVYMSDNSRMVEKLQREIRDTVGHYPEHEVEEELGFEVLSFKADIPSGVDGSYSTQSIYLLRESEYNQLAGARGMELISLRGPGEVFFIDEYYTSLFREPYTDKIIKINIEEVKEGPVETTGEFKVAGFQSEPVLNVGFLRRALVVRDGVYDQLAPAGGVFRGRAYQVSEQRESGALTAELSRLMGTSRSGDKKWELVFSNFYQYYRVGIVNYGEGIFIGAFLGLVFLISTGSIIFFKQLSEAGEEKIRYRILKNIGVNRQEIRSLVSRQMFFVFALPLAVGIIHSLVAVSILKKLLSVNLLVPISVTITVYTLIYMVYYLATVKSYIGIVDPEQGWT